MLFAFAYSVLRLLLDVVDVRWRVRDPEAELLLLRHQLRAVTHLPPGVPAQVAQQITQASHAVFTYGFVDAMKSTLYLPIAVLLVGAAATLLIQRRVVTAGAAASQQAGASDAQARAS